MSSPFYFVTGANRGLGLAISKGLVKLGHRVILGCRSEAAAAEAITTIAEELSKELGGEASSVKAQMSYVFVDLEKPETFAKSVEMLEAIVGEQKLAALINNAGFVQHNDTTEAIAVKTITINYTNTVRFTEAVIGLVADGGRVVVMGSRVGLLTELSSEAFRERFQSENLTFAELDAFVEGYLAASTDATQFAKGYTTTPYNMSKVAINTWTRLFAARPDIVGRKITVTSCCPGWVRTAMTGNIGKKSTEEGADTPIWLATSDEPAALATGKFFGERAEFPLMSTYEWSLE